MDVFLTSTSTSGLTALGAAAARNHVLITDVLRIRLGEDHARLFAEPVPSAFGDSFDWYAGDGDTPRRMSALSENEQTGLRETLGQMTREIGTLADEMKDSADSTDRKLGETLAQAIEIPSEESIYALHDPETGAIRPILINWGWVSAEERQVRGVLTGMAAASRPAVPATTFGGAAPIASVSARSPIWPWLLLLGWLLLAILLALILWLMIRPCGLEPGRLAYFCPAPAVEASTLGAERLVLEDQIAGLERELAVLDRACQPVAPPLPMLTPPEPEVETDDAAPDILDQRLQEQGGQTGDLNFALFWDAKDDLDLHVTCPGGQTVNYRHPRVCGGRLDIDANFRPSGARRDPVENIFFDAPPRGQYIVRVHLFKNRTSAPKDFTLRVRQRNGETQNFSGNVSLSRRVWTQTITITE